jgi:4-amino-4-deoxy-L-arabinose transferase-like glycosyltransferase
VSKLHQPSGAAGYGPATWFVPALFVTMAAFRLCHLRILWPDEDYHLAAAIQVLNGKFPYRDFWYDKPPLNALFYAALGAPDGWPLRILDAAFVMIVCLLVYLLARDLWTRREGTLAALLMAFYLTFDLPSAIIPMAADFLMILPHLFAIWLAIRRRVFLSGIACGIALLINAKGGMVLACCMVLCYGKPIQLIAGFLAPNLIALSILGAHGAFQPYIEQVWNWGFFYARDSPVQHPWINLVQRTLNWMGFHSLLVVAAAWFWWRDRSAKSKWMAIWLAFSFAGVCLGGRFFPRYYLQLLPVAVIAGARGLLLLRHAPRLVGVVLLIALSVPVIRFAPRYAILASDLVTGEPHHWQDIVLDQDSRAAADQVNALKQPGNSMFVWGYRPGAIVYTRMPIASRFWDSQPLTGVPADRHLFDSRPIVPEWAARNRSEFVKFYPTFVVDSLSVANPRLAMENYPEFKDWLGHYRLVGQTKLSRIYEIR